MTESIKQIPGVGSGFSDRLKDAGYESISEIADTPPEQIASQTEISKEKVKAFQESARSLRGDRDTKLAAIAENEDVEFSEVFDAYASIASSEGSFRDKIRAIRARFSSEQTILDLDGHHLFYLYPLFNSGYEEIQTVAEASVSEMTNVPYITTSNAAPIRDSAREFVGYEDPEEQEASKGLANQKPKTESKGETDTVSEDNGEQTSLKVKGADLRDDKIEVDDLQNVDLSEKDLSNKIFSGVNLSGADLSEANLENVEFRKCDLSEADLSDADLTGSTFWGKNDLTEATIRDATIVDAKLGKTDFSQAVLRRSNLKQSSLRKANFENADLREANLEGTELKEAHLEEAQLRDASLSGANLRYASLENAYAWRLDLSDSILREAKLINADLREVNLGSADIRKANFTGADLSNGDLDEVKADNAIFVKADLSESTLERGDCEGANFEEAILVRANFQGTDLVRANLSNSYLFGVSFDGARISSMTKLVGDGTVGDFSINDRCRYDPDVPPYKPEQSLALDDERREKTGESLEIIQLRRARSTYWRLEKLARQNGFPKLQSKMFQRRQEMGRKLVKRQGQMKEWLFAETQRFLFVYGESFKRVIAMSGGSIILFWMLALGTGSIETKSGTLVNAGNVMESPGMIWDGLYHSIMVFFTGGSPLVPINTLGEVLVALESMLGPIFVALLIFVLGRRSAR